MIWGAAPVMQASLTIGRQQCPPVCVLLIMPPGTRHELVGLVEAHDAEVILHMPDGRRWQLHSPEQLTKYLGCKVRVYGTNAGSGILHVERIEPLSPGQGAQAHGASR